MDRSQQIIIRIWEDLLECNIDIANAMRDVSGVNPESIQDYTDIAGVCTKALNDIEDGRPFEEVRNEWNAGMNKILDRGN